MRSILDNHPGHIFRELIPLLSAFSFILEKLPVNQRLKSAKESVFLLNMIPPADRRVIKFPSIRTVMEGLNVRITASIANNINLITHYSTGLGQSHQGKPFELST